MRLIAILLSLVLSSCVAMAPQDPVAIKNATDIRVEVDLLIDKAVDPYVMHIQDVNFVQLRALQALEYAKAKDNNSQTVKQWEILIDKDRNLLGGFLKMWEKKESGFSVVFLSGVKKNILSGIDEIIKLEKAK